MLRWQNHLKALQGANLPLIPPLGIAAVGCSISLMMPSGISPNQEVKKHWLPLSRHLDQLVALLKARHLVLDDELQIKVSAGIPFVCDFSDLNHLSITF
jgi:hypothetical protein